MKNRTIFTNHELAEIDAIHRELIHDPRSIQSMRDSVTQFYIDNSPNRDTRVDLITEGWVNAVIQFLIKNGYEIKKGK